ncbi:flagellar hook protein FlgE [Rheinheimera pacifica]|uniref:Flagellar hook protein FlgE n=1 Tax=Rheinheimera pacifica TaxID=173990 RepID=A0A1H6J251_9GAMM|nr:flagellar hook-basal body complex protein [Rheinheimera pacifica]SEH54667.1 flagellar hook protein FlgE [Rheinheimera pacifica]
MSMFNIGLSGLKTTQKALEITSHNIANSGTAGFKSGSAEFASVYNGGQRGGVDVSDIKENFTREGGVVNTGSALDLAITGKGFFVVAENGRMAYTQAGRFDLDKDQNIVNTSGNRLQGYGIDANGNLVPGVLTDLKIEAANIPAEASDRVDFSLNLSGASDIIPIGGVFDPTAGGAYNYSQSTELFDSLGNSHTLTQYFNHLGGNDWQVTYYVDGNPLTAAQLGANNGALDIAVGINGLDKDNNVINDIAVVNMSFGTDGQLAPLTNFPVPPPPAQPDNNVQDPYNLREIVINFTPTGADPMALTVDLAKSTQFGSGFNIYKNDANGFTAGEFAGVAIAETGEVFATFTNGETKLQGQVVLANFANINGLETGNKTVWYATNESGAALYGTPDAGSFGALLSGAYVGSNVDISEQLVDLMAFQQNYQANAKTISTADQMMQVLFNAT